MAGPMYHPSDPWGSFGRFVVDEDTDAGRGDRCSVEVVVAMDLGPGREVGVDAGSTKEV